MKPINPNAPATAGSASPRRILTSALLLNAAVVLVLSVAQAMTASINGQECPMRAMTYDAQGLVVDSCTAYLCRNVSGVTYYASGALSVPGTCVDDRIHRGSFE